MKSYIKKILLFLTLILIYNSFKFCVIYYSFPQKQHYTYYGYNQEDKPRLILLGSSNVQANYNYELLNTIYPDFNVVGCCLNEPSGLFVTLHKLAELNIKESDIVVFVLPHSFYESAKFLPIKNEDKYGYSRDMLLSAFHSFPALTIKSFLNMSLYRAVSQKRKAPSSQGDSYKRFTQVPPNQRDPRYVDCWTSEEDKFMVTSSGFEKDYIVSIKAWLSNQFKCTMYFRFASITEEEYILNQERTNYLMDEFVFINLFESSIYPKSQMYDQWYHLNMCGRDVCTSRLISELGHKRNLN